MPEGSRSGTMLRILGALALAAGAAACVRPALAEDVTCLLPAPPTQPGLAPFLIAQHDGLYAAQGLTVSFVVAKGGADAAKQVGAGNADVAVGLGDTPLIVRAHGVPIKAVAVLGGRALTQLVSRADAGVRSPADLKGKIVTVMAYQDTTYYALLGMLAKVGLAKEAVNIQAVGPAAVWQLVASGNAQAMAGVPDWGADLEAKGVTLTWISSDEYFPGMASAIISSDEAIAKRPALVRKFVQATLAAMARIKADPARAARDYIAAVPQQQGNDALITRTLQLDVDLVYPGQAVPGAMDAGRLAKLQDFYLSQGIVETRTPVEQLYTNAFVE